jgi:hypothetical protein
MNIVYLNVSTYNQTMELFRVWLKKHNIDPSDRNVRAEVEELVGSLVEVLVADQAVRGIVVDDEES